MNAGQRDPAADPYATRLRHIDAIRAVAVMLVLIHHFITPAWLAPGEKSPLLDGLTAMTQVIDFGRLGVNLFFVVSGYVIGHSLLGYPRHHLRQFAISRLCRLFPAYWLSLAFIVVFRPPSLDAGEIAVNAAMIQKFVGVKDAIGVYWTLAVELAFYVLCAVLFVAGVLARTRRLIWVFVLLAGYATAAAVLRYATGIALPFAWPVFLSLMVGGLILRRWNEEARPRDARFWGAVALYLAAMLVTSYAIYHDPAPYQKSWIKDYLAVALAAAGFLVLHYRIKIRWRAFSFVGVVSYSLYLFRTPVIALVIDAMQAAGMIGRVPPWLSLVIVMVCSLGVAALLFYAVEKPGVRLGRRQRRAVTQG